jgi:hypothetical protein
MIHGYAMLLHNSLDATPRLVVAVQWMHADLSKGQAYYSHRVDMASNSASGGRSYRDCGETRTCSQKTDRL